MSKSLFPRTEAVERTVRNINAAVGGGISRVQLNRDSLIPEHHLLIDVSQDYTGVPTSSDVGRFIKSISVETDNGEQFNLSGKSAYEMTRFTEDDFLQEVTLAATSTAKFLLDLHYENDGALRDLATALEASPMSTFDLVIEWAPDANNGFLGGTVPLVATYNVEVISRDFPDMQHTGSLETDEDGNPSSLFGIAQFAHFVDEQVKPGTTSGKLAPIPLKVSNSTRFIMLIAEDTTGGNFVANLNDLITDIELNIGGKPRRKVSFDALRFDNKAKRSFSSTGVVVMDWGDDEVGFLDLEGVADALLEITVALPGGVTDYNVRVVQDYTR